MFSVVFGDIHIDDLQTYFPTTSWISQRATEKMILRIFQQI